MENNLQWHEFMKVGTIITAKVFKTTNNNQVKPIYVYLSLSITLLTAAS